MPVPVRAHAPCACLTFARNSRANLYASNGVIPLVFGIHVQIQPKRSVVNQSVARFPSKLGEIRVFESDRCEPVEVIHANLIIFNVEDTPLGLPKPNR